MKSTKKIGNLNSNYNKKYNIDNSLNDKNIIIFKDTYSHIKNKHKSEFSSNKEYHSAINNLPEIVGYPDYVTYNEYYNSIEFVKENILVPAILTNKGYLKIKTMYPISKQKYNNKRHSIPENITLKQ